VGEAEGEVVRYEIGPRIAGAYTIIQIHSDGTMLPVMRVSRFTRRGAQRWIERRTALDLRAVKP
jgi:hypothetical protein